MLCYSAVPSNILESCVAKTTGKSLINYKSYKAVKVPPSSQTAS
jgi:hypothetical protein